MDRKEAGRVMGWQPLTLVTSCPLWLRKACSVSTPSILGATGVAGLVTSPLAAMLPDAGNPVRWAGEALEILSGEAGDVWTISGEAYLFWGGMGGGVGSDCV